MDGSEEFRFDGVQLAAEDPEEMARAYAVLIGLRPVRLHSGALRFQLERGALEIEPGPPGVRSIRFTVASAVEGFPMDRETVADLHGVTVRGTPVIAGPGMAGAGRAGAGLAVASREGDAVGPPGPRDTTVAPPGLHAIDHVVVRCADAARAIALWRDRLGLRLALDREFPQRGLRMLFFRSGGVTLEFVSAIGEGDAQAGDALDGIAYRTRDAEGCRARLAAAGFDVSEVRPGNKAGTRVATVRSGTGGVPTLIIEHPERGDPA